MKDGVFRRLRLVASLWVLGLACAAPAPEARAQPAGTRTGPGASTAAAASAAAADGVPFAHGLFADVRVFRPARTATQFVMLLTADVTAGARERQMLRSMLEAGAMVAVVPLAPFQRRLEAQDGRCTYAAGAFENLSRHLQAFERLPGYLAPMLVAADDEAALVYALLAQAPVGTFAAGLSLGFCPRLEVRTPPCATNALRLEGAASAPATGASVMPLAPPATLAAPATIRFLPAAAGLPAPWIAMPDADGAACTPAAARAFVAAVPRAEWWGLPAVEGGEAASEESTAAAFDKAWRKLAVPQVALGAPPAQLADLPIVEVPATGRGTRFAVLLSGDGGWAGIDKSLGAALAAQGVPVAGLDSLRYFWSKRTPAELAADLDRVIRYYAARWGRADVLLIGYSQGADVLPFAVNRLPPRTRANVRLTALLAPGQRASFEFHLANWIGPSGDLPIAPEALKLGAANTLCVYGLAEKDSLCPGLAPDHARLVPMPGDHHFGGAYDALAARILEAVPR